MKLEKEELATLDLTEAHEKALEAHEQLERLAKIAADPDAYTLPEFQAAMDTAKYIESYWGSGPIALEAEDVVAAFVSQVEARRACRKYNLVPRAELDEAMERLKQADHCVLKMTQDMAARLVEPKSNAHKIVLSAADVQTAIHPGIYCPSETDDFPAIADRINAIIKEARALSDAPKPAPLGPGDPLPPPPPPTKAAPLFIAVEPWTGETFYQAYRASKDLSTNDWPRMHIDTKGVYEAFARIANDRMGIKAP